MKTTARLAALSAACLVSACAGASGRFVCPTRGGDPWHELRSEHAVLQTDLPAAAGEALLRDIEGMRALVLAAMFKTPPPLEDRFRAVALRSDEELWELTGDHRGFGSWNTMAVLLGPATAEPVAALVPPTRKLRQDYLGWLAHEITLQLGAALFPNQPAWFKLGLATSMEPLGDQDDDGRGKLGASPAHLRLPPFEEGGVTLAAVLDGSAPPGHPATQTISWLLVRWLSEHQPAGFADLQRRLGRDEDGRSAWRAAFPRWSPDRPDGLAELQAELSAFAAKDELRYRLVSARATPTIARRALGPAEVHGIRLRLQQGLGGAPAAAEVAEALAEDPLDPVVLRLSAGATPSTVATQAKAATEARPDDWRAWLLLGDAVAAADAPAAAIAYRRAHQAGQGEPAAALGAAAGLARLGQAADVLAPARDGVRLAPWAPEGWLLLAGAAAQQGSCPEALKAARRARVVAPDEARKALEEALAPVGARCGGGPAPADGPAAP